MDSFDNLVRGNPESSVAICTLSSTDLLAAVAASPLRDEVAIVGGLETENTGVESLLRTLLRTPTIRWLVICGEQNPRRKQGDILSAVLRNGVTPDGAIRGFGQRRLPSLRAPEVDAVREQVGIENLNGVTDIDVIAEAVHRCAERAVPPLGPRPAVETPLGEAIKVPVRPFTVRHLDPSGYFVIGLDRDSRLIVVDHLGNDHQPRHRLVGPDAESLISAILEWDLLSMTDHGAYLGMELTRAEVALRRGEPYQQDSAK